MPRLIALVLLTLCVGACNRCNGSRTGRDAGAAGATRAASATPRRIPRVGTVVGRIRLAEGAELPRWSDTDIGRDPEVPNNFPECGAIRDSDTLPVVGVGSPTALAGVMVSATGDRETFFDALGDWEPTDRHVAIDDCRLTPKLVTATSGDSLVIENHTNLAFLPAVGPTEFYETLVQNQSRRVILGHGGLTTVRCGFAADCGRTDLIVILHPVHTSTGTDGRFEMTNVPADQTVQIHAWHPLFRDAMVETRVARGGRVEVEITISPRPPRPVPTEPATPPAAAVGPSSDFPPGWENERDPGHPDRVDRSGSVRPPANP